MQDSVNFISNFLASREYEITKTGLLKKKGARKSLELKEFFKEFVGELGEISLPQFEYIVKQLTINKETITQGLSTLSDLMAACGFIYEKFRWVVTREKTKMYFLKTREDAEEYFYLTTDKDSQKFFNCLNVNELFAANELVKQFNFINGNEPIDVEKLMGLIVRDIRTNPVFSLAKEPITLSNNPLEPCFKFFDIEKIQITGDNYFQRNGYRPPTPAWDCFFARVRDQNMVPLVKAYLAGLFIAENTTKQALYIFGNGNDGKSQITECLAKKMGEEATFMLPQNMRTNNFTMMDAFGKRMFLGEELQSPNVIKHGMLHAILGGSRVRLEPKNESAFFARVYCCGVITSNYAPQIDDVKNQISRLLYIEMNPTSDEEINRSGKAWSLALQTEFDAMIYEGYQYYKKFNPTGSSFKMPTDYRDTLEELFDEKSKLMGKFIEEVFVYDENGFIGQKLLEAFLVYVKANRTDKTDNQLPPEYKDNKVGKELYEKLLVKFPHILKKKKMINGKQHKGITGLSIIQTTSPISNIFRIK